MAKHDAVGSPGNASYHPRMQKILISFVAMLGVMVVSAATAAADSAVKTDAVGKFSYEVPAGFTESTQGNITVVEEPTKSIAFFLVRTDDDDAQKAMGELDATVSKIITDVKPVKAPTKGKYNGMEAVQIKATGTFEKQAVNVTLRFLKTPTKKYLIVVGAYLTAKKPALAPTFEKFYDSIKPVP
jgi:hypothetical protein